MPATARGVSRPERRNFERRASYGNDAPDDGEHGNSLTGNVTPLGESIRPDRLPACMAFIVANEFCERFTYYGIKTVLEMYFLSNWIGLDGDDATASMHIFTAVAYTAPLLGAFLADGYLGRFQTILWFSVLYSVGSMVLCASSISGLAITAGVVARRGVAAAGLFLLAIGTGGIKPCVSAFGADQIPPGTASTERLTSVFFSVFYVTINAGSMLSMFTTPLLRNITCQGQKTCYPLAFGVPAVLMLISTLLFVAGSRIYRNKGRPHQSNARGSSPPTLAGISRVLAATWRTRGHQYQLIGQIERYQTDESDQVHDQQQENYNRNRELSRQVSNLRGLLRILRLFLPLPLFWALYDQMTTRWTEQASKMDLRLHLVHGSISPDQMPVANALLVLALVPVSRWVYSRVQISLPSRMTIGMLLVSFAFFVAAAVQHAIDRNGDGTVQVFWQVPQYVFLTAGEVLFSVSGLELAYAHAPAGLRSVCQAAWLLTVAAGNVIVAIVAEARLFRPVAEFVFFAGAVVVAAAVFGWLARSFEHEPAVAVSGANASDEPGYTLFYTGRRHPSVITLELSESGGNDD